MRANNVLNSAESGVDQPSCPLDSRHWSLGSGQHGRWRQRAGCRPSWVPGLAALRLGHAPGSSWPSLHWVGLPSAVLW